MMHLVRFCFPRLFSFLFLISAKQLSSFQTLRIVWFSDARSKALSTGKIVALQATFLTYVNFQTFSGTEVVCYCAI